MKDLSLVTKTRIVRRTGERFGAPISIPTQKSLPTEIREEDAHAKRQTRVEELRRQYLTGTYYVPASEISSALLEKHLKR
jgi:anti-sigma28 factor (negative regulator of flagellin synthesis)